MCVCVFIEQRRLDQLQTTKLDLMITEYDLKWPDVVERADAFEDVVRTYFAHPGVIGMILWGFWNKYMGSPNSELVNGTDLKVRLYCNVPLLQLMCDVVTYNFYRLYAGVAIYYFYRKCMWAW